MKTSQIIKNQIKNIGIALLSASLLVTGLATISAASTVYASGGGAGGNSQVDSIKVSKCYINSAGQMLIKASSSNAAARLFAYRPDGSLIGEVQNGGGSRYGGTVMPFQPYDPVYVTIVSTLGGAITVPTTPFQL